MSMDISDFYQTFFDEADELLADMEQHLLDLVPEAPTPSSSMPSSALRTPLKAEPEHLDLPSCRKPPI